jgi:hypothetical protein
MQISFGQKLQFLIHEAIYLIQEAKYLIHKIKYLIIETIYLIHDTIYLIREAIVHCTVYSISVCKMHKSFPRKKVSILPKEIS